MPPIQYQPGLGVLGFGQLANPSSPIGQDDEFGVLLNPHLFVPPKVSPLTDSNPLLSKHNADFGLEKSLPWLSVDESAINADVNWLGRPSLVLRMAGFF